MNYNVVKSSVFAVYVLPIICSVALGSFVMVDALESPDRELNMLQFGGSSGEFTFSSSSIGFVGLDNEYLVSDTINFQIKVSDKAFNCGDIYMTIYDIGVSPKEVITQTGYFKQCYADTNKNLPIGENFSESLDSGKYEIIIELYNENYQRNIISSTKIIVE